MIRRFKNITFIGTSHISKESITLVEKTLLEARPSIIALELDNSRFHALLSKKPKTSSFSSIGRLGVKGFIFGKIGALIENRLGKFSGSSPGSEMKKAILIAKEKKTLLALIDQDISITLKRISESLTFNEKLKFIKDFIKSFFIKLPKGFDISKVPEEDKINQMSNQLKKEYPNIHKTLIIDRNIHMSKALYKLSQDNSSKDIVAIIGAGHVKGIISLLKKEKWSIKKVINKKRCP